MNALQPTKFFALSAKAIIHDQEGRCLLVRRSAGQKWSKGKWDFPGGKAEPGEKFDQTLLREIKEETGLFVTLLHVAGVVEFELPAFKIACIIMEAHLVSGEVRLSREHDDFVWVALQELPNMDLAEPYIDFSQTYSRARR